MSEFEHHRLAQRIRDVKASESDRFDHLIHAARLDAAQDLRFGDRHDLDLSAADLRGFDFTGSDLTGARFRGVLILGATFDRCAVDLAALREAADFAAFRKDELRRPAVRRRLWSDRRLRDLEQFRDTPFSPEMIVIPAGSFMMGSPEKEPERFENEGPGHRVTIARRFAAGRDAVTRGEFAAFVEATGHTAEGAYKWTGREWKFDPKASWRDPGFPQDDDHPVVCVDWDDAMAYVEWLARITGKPYRLLTEAEWEYAARAGTTKPFWWGSAIAPDRANYDGSYVYKGGGSKGEHREGTVPVGSFAANPWGLYNVHGNVWEWCEDVWHDSYEGAPADGSAWTTGDSNRRVVRGGSLHLQSE